MAGKRWWLPVALAMLMTASGCCRFCDRWCGHGHGGATSQACVPCVPAPVCCPTPAASAPVCPPGTVPATSVHQPGGWQRNYNNGCACP
jgi:hypothetical protein